MTDLHVFSMHGIIPPRATPRGLWPGPQPRKDNRWLLTEPNTPEGTQGVFALWRLADTLIPLGNLSEVTATQGKGAFCIPRKENHAHTTGNRRSNGGHQR